MNFIYRSSSVYRVSYPLRTLMYWKKIHLYVNILQLNSAMENQQKSKLNVKQRFSCGFGIVLNEVFRQMYISFSIIFLMQVIGLSASQAGLAMLIGQTTDAFTSPITGFLGDRVRIPFISKKLGRRKSWHLVGTVMMAGGLPLLFNRCLVCNDYQGVSWLKPFYFYCVMVIINVAGDRKSVV